MGETMARLVAEVERLLKSGSLERIFKDELVEDEGGGVYMDEARDDGVDVVDVVDELSENSVEDADERLAESLLDEYGPSPCLISPKYCSVSLTASSCWTPTNATTILSGL